MAVPTADAYSGTPGQPIYGGREAPAVVNLVTTLSLENTSGSAQPSGFVTPMFGMPFKQGDIPAGQHPDFTLVDGTPCPATTWGHVSWPDGSMKFCGAMILVPALVPGAGSVEVLVKSGGSTPSPSGRTVANLSAADIKIEITGTTNLSGTWTAGVNDGVSDGTEVVLIGDGGAGAVWRICSEFRQGGSAHGQLYCWHYVAAINGPSGEFGGARYLGRAGQPWGDVSTPASGARSFTGDLKSGAATVRSMQGTQSGESVSSVIDCPHYTSFFTCGSDGKWDHIQGGGSVSSAPTIRVVQDRTHMVRSRMLPPYDLALTVNSGTSVSYVPYCSGGMNRSIGTSGERDDIGILPAWAARHAFTQSAADEQRCRVAGLAAGGWRTLIRNRSTRKIIPSCAPRASYAGLATPDPDLYFLVSGYGLENPSQSTLWSEEYDTHHIPAANYYPYLITGEPQYLDMMIDKAAQSPMRVSTAGSRVWKTGNPIDNSYTLSGSGSRDIVLENGGTYNGGGMLFKGSGARISAWFFRDCVHAAALCPDSMPGGSQENLYLRDMVDNSLGAYNAYNAARPQSHRDGGIHFFVGFDEPDESPWMLGYVSAALNHGASIYPGAPSTAARSHIGRWFSAMHTTSNIAHSTAYRVSMMKSPARKVEDASEIVYLSNEMTLTFSAATGRATISGANAYQSTDGDVYSFLTFGPYVAVVPFPGATNHLRLYAVNSVGATFQLALTPGGAPISVPSNVTINQYWCAVKNFPANFVSGSASPEERLAAMRAYTRQHVANGDSFVDQARISLDARKEAAGIDFTTNPKHAMTTAYPA